MSIAAKGIYKDGKIKLLEELKGVKEADVLVVVIRKRENVTTKIVEALKEVKLMRDGKLSEREWCEVRDEI